MKNFIQFEHAIGDPYYIIKTDKNNVPRVKKADLCIESSSTEITKEDGTKAWVEHEKRVPDVIESIEVSKNGVCYRTESGRCLTDESMKKNIWFWSKEDAQVWLKEHYDKKLYSLKPGDKLVDQFGFTYTIRGLRFGGLYEDNVDTMDQWALDHSYKTFFKKFQEPWYIADGGQFPDSPYDQMVIGTGQEGDPYRVDYLPRRHNPVQFNSILQKVPNIEPEDIEKEL